ncbi:hypothetical protein DFQ26_001635, partial [Actinomortierella ambigua]
LDTDEFESALMGFIERHYKRLWRLRVTQAEIRFNIQSTKEQQRRPRTHRASPSPTFSSCVLDVDTYHETRMEKGYSDGERVAIFTNRCLCVHKLPSRGVDDQVSHSDRLGVVAAFECVMDQLKP